MHFGLMNASAISQRLMDAILTDFPAFTNVYIDDVVIFIDTWVEHLVQIAEVLSRFRQHGLTIASKIMLLCHIAGEGNISVPECRVQNIRDFKLPQAQSTGYYQRFIFNQHNILISSRKQRRRRRLSILFGLMLCWMNPLFV